MLAQVYACVFNPVDDGMVGFVPNDGTALIYQLNDSHLGYDEPRVIQHSDRSTKCIEFSPNGRWLAVGGASTRPRGTQTIAGYIGKISLYDVQNDFCPAIALQETENTVFSCAFSACRATWRARRAASRFVCGRSRPDWAARFSASRTSASSSMLQR